MYLDDIIVFSQSAGELVEHLREVFAALRCAGVSLIAKKCHYFQEAVEYMGHLMGRGQLKVQDKNVRGLKDAPPARCKKDLRSFVGMCNLYRKFVKDYAQVSRPLAAMTSFKRPYRWGVPSDEALGAFQELKRRLTEALIRGRAVLTRWTPTQARGRSARSYNMNSPKKSRSPWATGLAPSMRWSGTTAVRSGSASRW